MLIFSLGCASRTNKRCGRDTGLCSKVFAEKFRRFDKRCADSQCFFHLFLLSFLMMIVTRCKALFRCSSILAVVRRSSSNSFLAQRHDKLVEQTQNLLKKIQSEFAILSVDEKKLLNDAQRRIDSIFLFVVVGEFNSGKSQFINTFLGEKELCPTGVLPTTDTVNIIRYGTRREDRRDDEHIRSIFVPNEWLKQTNIVDTPGTNAILQSHQQITGRRERQRDADEKNPFLFCLQNILSRNRISSCSSAVSIGRFPRARSVSSSRPLSASSLSL